MGISFWNKKNVNRVYGKADIFSCIPWDLMSKKSTKWLCTLLIKILCGQYSDVEKTNQHWLMSCVVLVTMGSSTEKTVILLLGQSHKPRFHHCNDALDEVCSYYLLIYLSANGMLLLMGWIFLQLMHGTNFLNMSYTKTMNGLSSVLKIFSWIKATSSSLLAHKGWSKGFIIFSGRTTSSE